MPRKQSAAAAKVETAAPEKRKPQVGDRIAVLPMLGDKPIYGEVVSEANNVITYRKEESGRFGYTLTTRCEIADPPVVPKARKKKPSAK